MNPYLTVVILEPTVKEKEEGQIAKLISDLQVVLAKDESHAKAKALIGVPEEYRNNDERLVVRLIPFC